MKRRTSAATVLDWIQEATNGVPSRPEFGPSSGHRYETYRYLERYMNALSAVSTVHTSFDASRWLYRQSSTHRRTPRRCLLPRTGDPQPERYCLRIHPPAPGGTVGGDGARMIKTAAKCGKPYSGPVVRPVPTRRFPIRSGRRLRVAGHRCATSRCLWLRRSLSLGPEIGHTRHCPSTGQCCPDSVRMCAAHRC